MVQQKIYTTLSLGSNMGNRRQHLKTAIELISEYAGNVTLISSCYRTAAWGPIPQQDFYNCVAELETVLTPLPLLEILLKIETKMGRVRKEKFGPRVIDLDILFYGDQIINDIGLQIPHPFITDRQFILIPMVELKSQFIHPANGKTMLQLLKECTDRSHVHKLKLPLFP